jgi:hypothetical protein
LLERSSAVRDLENEVYQLEQVERQVTIKQVKGKPLTTGEQAKLARLGRLREVASEVKRQRQEACELEDGALAAFHAQAPVDSAFTARLDKLAADWDALLLAIYKRGQEGAARLTLGLFAEDKDRLFAQAEAYAIIARNRGLAVTAVQYLVAGAATAPPGSKLPKPPEPQEEVKRVWEKDYLLEVRKGEPLKVVLKRDALEMPFARGDFRKVTVGLGLHLAGPEAVLRFAGEAGLHQFQVPSNKDGSNPDVLVEAEAGTLEDYVPPERIERRGEIGGLPPRRVYVAEKQKIVDPGHELNLPWEGDLLRPLTELTGRNLAAELMRLVLE